MLELPALLDRTTVTHLDELLLRLLWISVVAIWMPPESLVDNDKSIRAALGIHGTNSSPVSYRPP